MFMLPHLAGSPKRPVRLNAEIQAGDIIANFGDPFAAVEDAQGPEEPVPEPVTRPVPSSYQTSITDRFVRQQMELDGYSPPLPSVKVTTKKRKSNTHPPSLPASKRVKRAADILLDDSSCDSQFATLAANSRKDMAIRLQELDTDSNSNPALPDQIRANANSRKPVSLNDWAASRGIQLPQDLNIDDMRLVNGENDDGGDDGANFGQVPEFEKSATHSRDQCFFCVYEGKQLPKDILVEYRVMLEYFEEHIASVPSYKLAEAIYLYYETYIRKKLEASVPDAYKQSMCPKMSPEIVYSHIMVCTRDPRVFQATAIDMSKRLAFRLLQNCETMITADFNNRINGLPPIELDKKMLTLSERWLKMVVFLYKLDTKKCAFYNPLKNRPIHKLGALGLMPTYDLMQDQNNNDDN